MKYWIALLLVAPCALPAGAIEVLAQTNPLDLVWLSVPDATKTQMRSGFDYHDGNYDSGNLLRVEPADLTFSNAQSAWVLFEASGPGALTSLWFTGKNKRGEAYLGGRLNFFFDGEAIPSISGRLPELFERGAVFPAPLAEKSSGGWVCYAPLRFARSLKITLTEHGDTFTHRKNGRGEVIPHLYHQFTWQRLNGAVRTTSLKEVRSQRPWRRDESGTRSRTRLAARSNEWHTLFQADGQGIVNGWWLRWKDLDPDRARLCIIADGQTNVHLAVPEFWGFHRTRRPQAKFQSLVLGIDDEERYYCFFPMPHRQNLRLAIQCAEGGGSLEFEALHRRGWPLAEHLAFHAARVADRCEPGRDLQLLSVRGRGHFVGTLLALPDQTLEGDDRFYVDGEPFPPAWHGTGTEDYFRCGWYFHGGALTRPIYGLLDNARPKLAYRFQVADRVNFVRSVSIGFEHGHGNQFIGAITGVVFWYEQADE